MRKKKLIYNIDKKIDSSEMWTVVILKHPEYQKKSYAIIADDISGEKYCDHHHNKKELIKWLSQKNTSQKLCPKCELIAGQEGKRPKIETELSFDTIIENVKTFRMQLSIDPSDTWKKSMENAENQKDIYKAFLEEHRLLDGIFTKYKEIERIIELYELNDRRDILYPNSLKNFSKKMARIEIEYELFSSIDKNVGLISDLKNKIKLSGNTPISSDKKVVDIFYVKEPEEVNVELFKVLLALSLQYKNIQENIIEINPVIEPERQIQSKLIEDIITFKIKAEEYYRTFESKNIQVPEVPQKIQEYERMQI